MRQSDAKAVLVADDTAALRDLIARILALRGWACETAGDGAEADALFGDGSRFVAVLTDHDMPGCDGLELLRRLRVRAPGALVVLMSADVPASLVAAAREAGAADVVDKALGLAAVVERLIRLIERQPAR